MTPLLRPIAAVFTPAEREELIRAVGMLDSADNGARASAAQISTNILAAHDLTWAEVIAAVLSGPAAAPLFCGPREPELAEPGMDDAQAWRAEAQLCLAKPSKLNSWERRFLKDILASKWPLSPKQQDVLENIGKKVRGDRT